MIDGQGVDGETALQGGVLVEIVDDHLGNRVALDFDDHARVLVRFVPHRRDVGDDLLVDQFRNPLDQQRAVHVVGNLGNDDLLPAAFGFLEADLAPHFQAAAAHR